MSVSLVFMYFCHTIYENLRNEKTHSVYTYFAVLFLCKNVSLIVSLLIILSENGLSQNSIMSMVQDHNGVLWFSTWDGINRFNGYDFKVYKARQGNKNYYD